MRRLAYSVAIREALAEEMTRDPAVFLIGEDIGAYGGCFGVTRGLLEKFGPERVRDTPISENTIVGLGAGAAMLGLRPVVEIMFMDFLTLAMDQLVNHAAKFHYIFDGQVKVPLVIRTAAGAGRGYGATHSQTLDTWLLSVPGLKVVAPAFPEDAKGLLKSAIRDDNPVIVIENKVLYGYLDMVNDDAPPVPLGKARVVREGSDVTLVSYSRMLHEALAAAALLAPDDVSCEVVDLRSLRPLDHHTLAASVRKTGRVVLVEEGVRCGGLGAEVGSQIVENCFDRLRAAPRRMGLPDVPIPCAYELERRLLPNAAGIAAEVRSLLCEGPRPGPDRGSWTAAMEIPVLREEACHGR
jgi:acetoin:2,6-dichlorophenolindophenol oxidoreductase subunit beta